MHGDDVGHVVVGRPAERPQTVAARIVVFIAQKVYGAVLRQQADGLTVADALLATVLVLFAVLADLQITGQIDDLADDADRLAGDGLAFDRRRDGGDAPGGLVADLFAHF